MERPSSHRDESVRNTPETLQDSAIKESKSPDGGRQAWLQVVVGWIVLFTTWGFINSFGVFQIHYEQSLGISASQVSMIGSIQNWLTFFVGAFSGRLLDLGYLRVSMIIGSLLQALGIFLASIAKSYWSLILTYGVLTGLGGGILFCPAVAHVATYFDKRRALAIGIASTGISIGGAIYPLMVQRLVPVIHLSWALRVLGLLNLTGLAIAIAIVRRRKLDEGAAAGKLIILSPLLKPGFLLIVSGIALNVWLVYFTFYYIPEFSMQELHSSAAQALNQAIIFNAIGIPARLVVPLCADRWGTFNSLVPVLVLNSATAYCWLSSRTTQSFHIYVYFAGFMNSSFQCLMPTAVSKLSSTLSNVGGTVGLAFTILSLFALSGPPIGGAIMAAPNGFSIAIVWAATSGMVGALLVFLGRNVQYSWSPWHKC